MAQIVIPPVTKGSAVDTPPLVPLLAHIRADLSGMVQCITPTTLAATSSPVVIRRGTILARHALRRSPTNQRQYRV